MHTQSLYYEVIYCHDPEQEITAGTLRPKSLHALLFDPTHAQRT